MNRFNIGDTVKVISLTDTDQNRGIQNGTVGVIQSMEDRSASEDGFGYLISGLPVLMYSQQLELIKSAKQKNIKYILQYDLKIDPFEFFETRREVEQRIVELSANPDLKRNSIKVYEVANVYPIKLETKVVFTTQVSTPVAMPKKKRGRVSKYETEAERKAALKAYKKRYMKKWYKAQKAKKAAAAAAQAVPAAEVPVVTQPSNVG